MLDRELSAILKAQAAKYPVVTLTGPRQSGKTTLVKAVFPEKPYVNLERPDVRMVAREDPNGFLKQYPDGAILDEFQNVPELLSWIQVLTDERQTNNQFILTGSRQLEVMNTVSQSLAGRTAVLKLLPFSLKEIMAGYGIRPETDAILYQGFYPRLHDRQIDPVHYYSDYLQTYVERDVRQLLQVKNLSLFERFLRLCAGRTGQLLNLNTLADDTGINHTTAREWLSVLEASFIIRLLPPWFSNIGKRLVKSPKLYFHDNGLAAHLLGIHSPQQISTHPLRGMLFENCVVMETIKHFCNRGVHHPVYFYRDSNGVEVDLFIQKENKWLPVEIKSAATFSTDMLKNLDKVGKALADILHPGRLVYDGDVSMTIRETRVVNMRDFQP